MNAIIHIKNAIKYILFFCLFFFNLYAIPVVELNSEGEIYSLGGYYELFEDTSRSLTLDDILKNNNQFIPLSDNNPNLGIKNSAFWIRFNIKNSSKDSKWIITIPSPHIHSIEFYKPENNSYTKVISGNQIPFYEREYKATFFYFSINPAEKIETYYFRFENTHDALVLPIRVESPKSALEENSNLKFFFGIYYGIIFSMFIYNLFIYISVREKTYLFYIFYLFFISIHILKENGLAYQYIWPDFPEWNRISFAFTTPISSFGTFLFCLNFFDLKKKHLS